MHRTINPFDLDKTTTKQRLFWKITLGGDPLCVIVSCQCNSGSREAVNPLVGFVGKELGTITS